MKKSKAKQIIEIPEYIAIERLKKYIDECDADEIARLLGEFFGGKCFLKSGSDLTRENTYEFKPDQYYVNEFDNILKERN